MLNPPLSASTEVQGTWDKVKDWISKSADVKTHFETLMKMMGQAIEHIVKIMVIFMLQTLVIPILLLWGSYGVLRGTRFAKFRGVTPDSRVLPRCGGAPRR